jgi:hypothetical protein
MATGENYDKAYENGLKEEIKFRSQKYEEASNKPPVKIPKLKERDKGTGDEK